MMLQLAVYLCLSVFHPFYVSVTEIRHNSREKSLEISCRMFYDDLEHTLEKQYRMQLDIVKPKDKNELNRLLNDYIRKHLSVTADGKKLEMSFIGYEIQEDGAWTYFEIKGVNTVKKITITDDLLFEQHPEQINMIHAIVNDQRRSTKLDNPEATANFVF